MAGGVSLGSAQGRITIDTASLQAAPNVAREAGRGVSKELEAAFKQIQNEQRLAILQAQQSLAVVRAQQVQITASTRAESAVRISAARAESVAQQEAAKQTTATLIEEQKRQTAAMNAELRKRQSQVGAGGFAQGVLGAALGSVGGPVGAIAGSLAGGGVAGIPTAIGIGVVESAKAADEASKVATAYNRQHVAAVQLAGSQTKLNELLVTYGNATGHAVDEATALSDVTSLMTQGFANSSKQLDTFLRGVRGASVAMAKPQDFIITRLQLELLNQTGMRLNEIGLGMDEVNQKTRALMEANSGLTQQQAYQQAVLDKLNEKFGKLSQSQEAQATGAEKAGIAAKNLQLSFGQLAGPTVNLFGAVWASALDDLTRRTKVWLDGLTEVAFLLQWMAHFTGLSNFIPVSPATQAFVNSMEGTDVGRHSGGGPGQRGPQFSADQTTAIREQQEGLNKITDDANKARLDETEQYESQRTKIIGNYETQIAREAEDFGRNRAKEERKFNQSIVELQADSARQRVKWQADLDRSLSKLRADTADKEAADRADAAERLADLDKKFERDEEKRQRDHRDRLIDAAGRLDAIAVEQEQRNFREQEADAKQARNDQAGEIKDQLQKRLDEEEKSLAKSITEQEDAHQRQLDEQVANDKLRIDQMKAAFVEQTTQEDTERGIRLQRQADDHQKQLDELGVQHGKRLEQISDQEAETRKQFTDESNKRLEELGIHNKKWFDEQQRLNNAAIALYNQTLAAQRRALNAQPGFPSLTDPFGLLNRPNSPASNSPTPQLPPTVGADIPLVGTPDEHDRLTGPAPIQITPPLGASSILSSSRLTATPPIAGSRTVTNSRASSLTIAAGAIVNHWPPGIDAEAAGDIFYQKLTEFYEKVAAA